MSPEKTETGNQKTSIGVVPTEDGMFTSVRFQKKNGTFLPIVTTWAGYNPVGCTYRFPQGVTLALATDWLKETSTKDSRVAFANSNSLFKPCIASYKIDIYAESHSGAVKRILSDDTFLLTIPKTFCPEISHSFISVCTQTNSVRIGVIINNKLEGVFYFHWSPKSDIGPQLAKLIRYWRYVLNRDDFPEHIVTFDKNTTISDTDTFSLITLNLPPALNSDSAIKAAGVALSNFFEVPEFELPLRHSFRPFRPLALKSAVGILVAAILISLIPFTLNTLFQKKLAEKEKIYSSFLKEDQAIQELNKTADELSFRILSVRKTYSRISHWGNLLQVLGTVKPSDLYIEKLASDQSRNSQTDLEIRMAGWSRSETSVTTFISKLQATEFMKNVSLSALERDPKNKDLCRYKIVCTMKLFEN